MASAGVSTLKCLVVDDHPVVRQGIRALLERELDGVEVSTAATPEAALQDSDGRPDVVVIDLKRGLRGRRGRNRSEEHTSELQSRRELVCRLLLEKKNQQRQ